MASLKVRNFLLKMGYFVRVDKVPGGCSLIYPHNKLTYKLMPEGFMVDNTEYDFSDFAVRMGIMTHIVKVCKNIHYKTDCIFYYNGEEVSSLVDIIQIDTDIEKENLLCLLLLDGLENEFSMIHEACAEENGVLKDFQRLVHILE